jgi:hypothetical protein
MCLTSTISWSSSFNAMGSGEEERMGDELCGGRLTALGVRGTFDAPSWPNTPLSRWSLARRSASDVTRFKGGLWFPGAIALGTRAAIFARFCSTISWASLSWEEPPRWGSESLLRLLGWRGSCPSDTASSRSFVAGCVKEIPFGFTPVGWEEEVRGFLGGIFVREAADNAFSWSA